MTVWIPPTAGFTTAATNPLAAYATALLRGDGDGEAASCSPLVGGSLALPEHGAGAIVALPGDVPAGSSVWTAATLPRSGAS